MKFKILVDDDRKLPWWEHYDKLTSNPRQWAEDTIKFFNSTRRGNERERVLLAVEVAGVHYNEDKTERRERGSDEF